MQSGWTPLHLAALKGHENVCRLLLDRGASIEAIDKNCRTPLHIAASNGHENACKLLLNREANIDAANENGYTPLHVAAYYDNENVCKLLLDYGATINAIDNNAVTPLHLAVENGDENLCKLLMDHGANIDSVTNFGSTPLHYSAVNGQENVCKLLLDRGANDQLKDTEGHTPLDLARSMNEQEIVNRLGSWTANPRLVTLAATVAQQQMGTRILPVSVESQPLVKECPFVEDLLSKIDISAEDKAKYKAAFIAHDITSPEIFVSLNPEMLRALGITSIGHQIKVEALIKTIRTTLMSTLSAPASRHPISYVPSAAVREKVAAAMTVARDQKSKFLFFASHNWGSGPDFANHAKVGRLVYASRAAGATVWFDSERLTGNIGFQIAKGIQESAVFVAFVTKLYIERVDTGGNSKDPDWCHLEFDNAFNNKNNKILTVVMEEQVKRDVPWTGQMGFVRGRLYVDFTSEDDMDRVISEMCDRMMSLLE